MVLVSCESMWTVESDSTGNHWRAGRRGRLSAIVSSSSERGKEETHPSWHETKTSEPRPDSQSSLSSELDGDETEGLISRGDEGKVGAREDIRREGGELGLGEDSVGVHPARHTEELSATESEKEKMEERRTPSNERASRRRIDRRDPACEKQSDEVSAQGPSENKEKRGVGRTITGPTQTSWILGFFSSSEGMTSAIRSTPFCFDHRPTKTNRSAVGSCLMPAHSCVSRLFSGRSFSAASSTTTFSTAMGSSSSAAMSVGSGFGSESMVLSVQRAGYRAQDRFPYLSETPATPTEFWWTEMKEAPACSKLKVFPNWTY
jgi:hypothetical protein